MTKVLVAAPCERIKAKITRWMWDNGAGINIISSTAVTSMKHLITKTENPLPNFAANGASYADREVLLKLTALKEVAKPYVLDGSPPLFSGGWRCKELGLDFWWPAYKKPIVVCPSGKVPLWTSRTTCLNFTAYSCGKTAKETIFRQFTAVLVILNSHLPASFGWAEAGGSVGVDGLGQAKAVTPAALELVPGDVVEDDVDTRSNLKLEALSVEHLFTHYPNNKYCSACQRARLRRRPIGVRSEKVDKAEKLGDIITCDHIIASRDEAEGLLSDKTTLTIYDMATQFTAQDQ